MIFAVHVPRSARAASVFSGIAARRRTYGAALAAFDLLADVVTTQTGDVRGPSDWFLYSAV